MQIGYQPPPSGSGTGTLAARPAATSVAPGYTYFATDDNGGTLYRSDGAVWTKIAPRGVELAYVERTTDAPISGPAVADIPGLVITFTPDTRPVMVEMLLPQVAKDATASFVQSLIVAVAGGAWVAQNLDNVAASSGVSQHLMSKLVGLTPGTTVSYKGQIAYGAGAGTVKGTASIRPFLRAYEI